MQLASPVLWCEIKEKMGLASASKTAQLNKLAGNWLTGANYPAGDPLIRCCSCSSFFICTAENAAAPEKLQT
jgi:hypothetical protein